METAAAVGFEGKIGDALTKIKGVEGDVKLLNKTVFSNGIPGHEHRIHEIEEHINNRRETCPMMKDSADKKSQRYIIWGLVFNGLMMLSGFAALILKG